MKYQRRVFQPLLLYTILVHQPMLLSELKVLRAHRVLQDHKVFKVLLVQ